MYKKGGVKGFTMMTYFSRKRKKKKNALFLKQAE